MGKKWKEAEFLHSEWCNPNVKKLWFANKEGKFEFSPGQFITLDLPVGEKRIDRWRSYSISSLSNGYTVFEIALLYMPNGKASKYLANTLIAGDIVRYQGPKGVFSLSKNDPPRCIFVCTGTGVVPFRSMLETIYKNGFPYPIHLIYGCRKTSDILYKEEFELYAQLSNNFEYHICLSQEEIPVLERADGGTYYSGYVHQVYKSIELNPSQDIFYLCGWSAMIDEAYQNLLQKGVPKENIRVELYG